MPDTVGGAPVAHSSAAATWAASGAMGLTGRADGPALVAPDAVVRRIAALGAGLGVDAVALLAERAAALDLGRRGAVSCGGATHLLPAADGWVAVALARPDDIAMIPAWLGADRARTDLWTAVASAVAARPAAEVADRAELLGMAVSVCGEVRPPVGDLGGLPLRATHTGPGRPLRGRPFVVDLSSLWAGPLCTRLLADRAAEVVKVESTRRPDGARRGPVDFFAHLNAGKRAVAIDLTTATGVRALRALIERADVVVEASRARALEAMGIVAADVVARGGPQIWVSITGYGRESNRVALGDDAAVAGGLVANDGDGPCFVADAVADPLSGVTAAAGVVAALAEGGRWLLDVSMAGVAAHVTGDEGRAVWSADERLAVAVPLRLTAPLSAPDSGADNREVERRLGITLS